MFRGGADYITNLSFAASTRETANRLAHQAIVAIPLQSSAKYQEDSVPSTEL